MVLRYGTALVLMGVASMALAAEKSPDQLIKSLESRIVELNGRGQYADAVPLAKQVVDLRQKKSGTEDPDYAAALTNLAMLDKSLGRNEEAQPLFEQSLAIRQKVLRPGDPQTDATLGALAEIYALEGKPEQAEPLLKQAEKQGASSSEIGNGAEAVGQFYLKQNHPDQAVPFLQQGLAVYQKSYPPGNPKLAAATANLALAYIGAGKPDQADPLLQQAVDRGGPEAEAAADVLAKLSDSYVAQNRPDDAAPLLGRAATIRQKLGTEDKNLAARIGNLAVLYGNANRYAEAVPLWERNIAIQEKIAGPESQPVAYGLDNLSIVYLNQADIDHAEPLVQRSAAIYAKTAGEASPQYAATQERLALIAQRRKILEQQKK
jgi:Tfp pilus assembly protein PilF